eukprot:jgi/Chrzof1/8754/Cz03g23090.t1
MASTSDCIEVKVEDPGGVKRSRSRSALSESLKGSTSLQQSHQTPGEGVLGDSLQDADATASTVPFPSSSSWQGGRGNPYQFTPPSSFPDRLPPRMPQFGTSPLGVSHWNYISGRAEQHPSPAADAGAQVQPELQHRRSFNATGSGSLKAHSRESSLTTPLLPVSHQADDFHHSGVIDGENVDQQGGPPTCAGVLVEEEFPPYGAGADAKATPQRDVLYGLINAIVGIPTMISFTAIVYQDPLYHTLLGQLARFSFFSAAVHQAIFTLCSSLPFAVGQPQDVGLIFLSSMATGIADLGRELKLSDDMMVGTALLTNAVATVIVGVLTLIVAKFKLATLVQYVPLPVVGGYLGYVGYFCLAAGIGLGCNTRIDTFSSWLHLFTKDALIKLIPTLCAALVLLFVLTKSRSPWAPPLVLAFIPAMFHVYLLASGHTLAEAQDNGWVLKPEGKGTQQFWELYKLYNIRDFKLDGIYLPGLIRQVPKMLGLFFVVTFGSCLDVAAIQTDMPVPIDFNRELGTVGLSNIVVGLSGSGYTGSYIFSQTIFSMRAGVKSAWHGAVIALMEAMIFLLPFSVVPYLPTFFFGALLTVFGIEISADWLIRSAAKVTRAEYCLLLATFLAIMQFELEAGVLIGILLCTIYFAVTYARAHLTHFTVVSSRSSAVRTYKERKLLDACSNRMVAVALSGYIFFGSSVSISAKVLRIAEALSAQRFTPPSEHAAATMTNGSTGNGTPAKTSNAAVLAADVMPVTPHSSVFEWDRLAVLVGRLPKFVLLDFRRVLGVDATAAQRFGDLQMNLRRLNVELVLTHLTNPAIKRLFAAHGVIAAEGSEQQGGACMAFDSLNEGTCYAENRLLDVARSAGLLSSKEENLTLHQYLHAYLSGHQPPVSPGAAFDMALHDHVDDEAAALDERVSSVATEVAKYGVVREVAAGEVLYDWGEQPHEFYLLLKGIVTLAVKPSHNNVPHLLIPAANQHAVTATTTTSSSQGNFQSGPGAVIGSTDVVLKRPRCFRAQTATACTLMAISVEAYQAMKKESPEVAFAIQVRSRGWHCTAVCPFPVLAMSCSCPRHVLFLP